MAKKTQVNSPGETSVSFLSELSTLTGKDTVLDIAAVDSVLLWAAIVGLAKRGASLQVGLTQDKSAWAIQAWDGKFPQKDYFRDTESLNRHLAALARVTWKREAPAQVEELIRTYGY